MNNGGTTESSPAPLYLPNIIAALLAAVGVVIGSIGPWATFFAFTRGATDGDGLFSLILGAIAVISLFALLNLVRVRSVKGWTPALAYGSAVAGLLSSVIAVVNLFHIKSLETEFFDTTISPEIGWGLWMVLICGVVLGITSFIVGIEVPKLRLQAPR